MVEVLVALALLGVFVGGLSTTLTAAAEKARETRERLAEAPAVATGEETTNDPWSWGPRVVDGSWRGGPVLYLTVERPTAPGQETQLLVGLWVDGWLLEEATLAQETGGPVVFEAPLWQGQAGKEVVVRIRYEDGLWGPPWRSLVPEDSSGEMPTTLCAPPGGARLGGAGVVIHSTRLSTVLPEVRVVQTVPPTCAGPPSVYSAGPAGRWLAQLGDSLQCWRGEDGRTVDVYF